MGATTPALAGQPANAVILAACALAGLGFLLMGTYALLARFSFLADSKLLEDIRFLYRTAFFLAFSLLSTHILTAALQLIGE